MRFEKWLIGTAAIATVMATYGYFAREHRARQQSVADKVILECPWHSDFTVRAEKVGCVERSGGEWVASVEVASGEVYVLSARLPQDEMERFLESVRFR